MDWKPPYDPMVGRGSRVRGICSLLLDHCPHPLLYQRELPTTESWTHLFTGYLQTWKLAYLPISDNVLYDKFGSQYNVTRVLTTQDTFDMDAYNNYSPLYLPATLAMTYLIAFTLSTCVLVHTLLYHGRALINGFKRIQIEKDDIHAKLMRSYPEVPDWWYGVAFITFFSCAIVAMEVWKTGVPIWALVLAVLLPVVYVLPSGFIYAMTGQSVGIAIPTSWQITVCY